MKTIVQTIPYLAALAVLSFQPPSFAASGIPEPGLVMYGSVTNATVGQPLNAGSVVWQVTSSSPAESVTVNSIIASVNGQFFYVARIPFETRALSGVTFQKTTNTLGLSQTGITYTRTAMAAGTNATLVYSSAGTLGSFTFDATKRGLVERVDLLVNLPVQPNQDTDGDGVPDWAEIIAGTDPNNANSVFKASSEIRPSPSGGLIIHWSSVAGKTYSILRTTNINEPFTPLATGPPATPAINEFTDTTATGLGPYFYRLSVQ